MKKFVERKSKLILDLELENFSKVLTLVNKIAEIAEEQNHHPNLRIFDYNKLNIEIYSHDSGKVTNKDYKLANSIEDVINDISQ